MFSLRSQGRSTNNKAELDMRPTLRTKAVTVCNEKIAKKGETVGLSFYAFFAIPLLLQNPKVLVGYDAEVV